MEPGANNEVAERASLHFSGLAIPVPTAATYDIATEGKTGWRFVLTRRWIAFVVGVIVYAGGCAAGVIWQWQLGQQIAAFNTTVSKNFDAPAVPVGDILPTLGSSSAAEQWRPVTAIGTWVTRQQLYVSERTCGSDTGFEVLTPLRLTDGRMLVIDRGCVVSSSANPTLPLPAAPPPAGTVAVTARVVASESAKGAAAVSGNQVDAIDLPQIATKLGAPTFTGAYGMLESQLPAPARALHKVLSGKPTVDGSAQLGTIFGTALYAVVGLGIFGYALREKFRFVNRFDPRLWRRELKRIQRLARKPYTDAEIEDLLIDGYSFAAVRALEAASNTAAQPPRELPPGTEY
ncbi:MAG TPA: SURF1 family cytochrome oxidase biogenesis protein [Galbitalea sp.]